MPVLDWNNVKFSSKSLFHTAIPTALVVTGSYYLLKRLYSWWTLPPGPICLPLVGKLLDIDKTNPHLTLNSFCDTYSNDGLCSIYVGTNTVILVSDVDVLKEMMSLSIFSGRQKNEFVEQLTEGCGIIFAEGDKWANQRRFALQVLRDFGFSKTISLDLITTELDVLKSTFEDFSYQPDGVKLLPTFLAATNNIIATLTLCKRFDHFDAKYKQIDAAIQILLTDSFVTNPQFLFPQLGVLTPMLLLLPDVRRIMADLRYMHSFFLREISNRRDAMKSNSEPSCLCDSYILEQQKAEANGDMESFRDLQIVRVCLELFLAGTDTTARSMEWLLLYMCAYPDIQQKVYLEITTIIGCERYPRMPDKSDLHYTMAVIDETYRKVSLVATGLFHRAMKSTTFHGYKFPSSATIFPMIHHIHHNPKYWNFPNEYRPEHFLTDDGKTYKPSPYLLIFLTGKRACLGESLARMEIFLMFTSIMQRFQVRLHADYRDKVKDILKGTYGAVRIPGEYRMVISSRYVG